ncbi:hypothetical protein BGZ95_005358 [Linnemannia exigua]|uniref:Uncharacterized protein n=1 Tax=Linnemannia exigua TaxID=604196 RepID=A0AAD4DGZ4_9FUNG|nr:hypothetical protein BGZ95_005358 [Linnemannia exigua]
MVKLKELVIGYECRRPMHPLEPRLGVDGQMYLRYEGPVLDTLELSLESGLERLSALKELEVFGFEWVNHGIGKRECWSGWLRLRVMWGLGKDRFRQMEYDSYKGELREYFQALRPDVVHEL